jgi:hypothetical protein
MWQTQQVTEPQAGTYGSGTQAPTVPHRGTHPVDPGHPA